MTLLGKVGACTLAPFTCLGEEWHWDKNEYITRSMKGTIIGPDQHPGFSIYRSCMYVPTSSTIT
jgi:hypothetical protein